MFYAIIIGELSAKESEAWRHPKLVNMHFRTPSQLLSCRLIIPRLDALVVQATALAPEAVKELSAAYPQAMIFINNCDSTQAQHYIAAGAGDVSFDHAPSADSQARALAHLNHRAKLNTSANNRSKISPKAQLPLRLIPV